jgi:hypothetical protein
MFTAVVLICSSLYLTDCQIISSGNFFLTNEECEIAITHDNKSGAFIRKYTKDDGSILEKNMVDYTCFDWNSTKV